MNNSTQEKKGNPVVTLKAEVEKFDFSRLRASKTNKSANSGKQMFLDFLRMRFVINKKDIDQDFIKQLYERYADLIENDGNGEKNYRQFAQEVFKEMFKYAEAQTPSDYILEELITHCNQAGYQGGLFTQFIPKFYQYYLTLQNPTKVMNIDCADINHITVKSDMVIPIAEFDNPEKKLSELDNSIEFTLESQDGKDDVMIYKDGKLSLTVPRKLRDYKIDGRSLFDIIKEYFYKFCEKLGFKFEVEIEHDLGDSIEVNSHLESVQPPIHSNEHGNTP